MKTAATNKRVRELITAIQDQTLIPRPEFQRRLVWSNKDKINFLDTVLRGYPFPEIYVADGEVDLDTGKGTQLLVDGQQRLTTLFEYFSGAATLRLSDHVAPYRSLTEEQKGDFLGYQVAVRDLGNVTEEEIVEVFRRINLTGYSLNEMEINNAIYKGEFKSFAETISDKDFFSDNRFFRPMQLRRMGDVKYILSILVTMMHGYFNRDEELEEYLSRYNEKFDREKEISVRFDQTLKFIERMEMEKSSRIWKQGDFFTAFCELDKMLNIEKNKLDSKNVKSALDKFFEKVDREHEESDSEEIRDYYYAVLQAANDRTSRIRRGEILRSVLSHAGSQSSLFGT